MPEAIRHDIYGPVHKAIRVSLGELIARLGRTDFNNVEAVCEVIEALRAQLRFSRAHLHHEDEHIHAALLARAPETVDKLEYDHAEHEAGFETLERAIREVETAAPGARGAAGRRLYLAFTVFAAHDLEHMAQEEQIVSPLLQSLFSDDELRAMEGAIVASMPPEEAMAGIGRMLPAMNPDERAGFLNFMRLTAPPEAFAAVIDLAARPNLPANDWRDLAERLNMAA